MNETLEGVRSMPRDTGFEAVQVGVVDAEIAQLEARLRAAQLAADVQALADLISDRLLFAGPDGRLATKAQDLEAHRSGWVRFLRYQPLELQTTRLTKDVAVTSVLAGLSVSVGGVASEGDFRYTRVWHREPDGCWRVAVGQVAAAAR